MVLDFEKMAEEEAEHRKRIYLLALCIVALAIFIGVYSWFDGFKKDKIVVPSQTIATPEDMRAALAARVLPELGDMSAPRDPKNIVSANSLVPKKMTEEERAMIAEEALKSLELK